MNSRDPRSMEAIFLFPAYARGELVALSSLSLSTKLEDTRAAVCIVTGRGGVVSRTRREKFLSGFKARSQRVEYEFFIVVR